MAKYVVKDTNDPQKLILQDCQGFEPEDYVCVAPLSALAVGDLDINISEKTARVNQGKVNSRLAAENALRAATAESASAERARVSKLAQDLKDAATLDDIKSILARIVPYVLKSMRGD